MAIVLLFVAVAIGILLALAARPIGAAVPGEGRGAFDADGAAARLAGGEPVPLSPHAVDVTPTEVDPASITVESTVSIDQGYQGPSPLGGPGPGPQDLPFATETRVTADPNAQTHPSIASESGGSVIYIAYTNQTTPTNRDVYVARSTDGGQTWRHIPVAADPTYNEFDPRIVLHGTRVVVFFANDDPANIYGFRHADSTDRGMTWSVVGINYSGPPPFRDLIHPDASSYNNQWLYAIYETNCNVPASCGGGPNRVFVTAMYDASMTLVSSVFFPFIAAPNVPLPTIEPSIIANADQTLWIGDADATNLPGGGAGLHDVLWIQTPTGQNTGTSWTGGFITQVYSSDVVHLDAAGFRPNFILSYQFINAGAGFPNHVIFSLYSTDSGTSWTLDLLASQAGVEFREPAVIATPPTVHATFLMGGNLGYANSTDASTTWSSPLKVNSNAGTTMDAIRSNDVAADATLGPMIAWQDSRDGNPNIYFTGIRRYTVTLETSPVPNLQVRFDGGAWATAPTSQALVAGSPHTIEARSPQLLNPDVRYLFSAWDDGPTPNPRSITVMADATYRAVFSTQMNITVTSSPVGRDVIANGGTRTTPYSFWCDAGTTSPVDVPSPQTVTATSRYRFDTWSDGGAQAHDITCDAPKIVAANFVLQFLVTVRTNAPGNPTLQVTVNTQTYTAPASFWFDQNSGQDLLAITPQTLSADTQVVFTDWTGGPPTPAWRVAITGATDYVANYKLQYRVILDTNPTGLQLVVEGVQGTAPITSWWDAGTSHSVIANSPQFSGTTTRYTFSAWSDGDVNPSRSITADAPKTVIAIFQTQYFLTMDSNPPGIGTLSPGNGWHNAGEPVTIQATAPAPTLSERYRFNQWSGDATGSTNPTTITMDAPKSVTANWFHEFRIEIQVSPGGPTATVSIDAGPAQSFGPSTVIIVWWNEGSLHTIDAQDTVPIGTDTRWNIASWSPGAGTDPLSVTVSGSGSYAASYARQFLITIATDPGTGPTVMVGSTAYTAPIWADEGGILQLDAGATPQSGGAGTRYDFTQWADGPTSATRAYTVTAAATLTAQYETQYLLTVTSPYGTPVCVGAKETTTTGCWYTAGATATVTVTSPATAGGQNYVIEGWSGDASGAAASVTISMSGPKAVTVIWRPVTFLESYGVILGILIAIIVVAILLALLLMRRRKKQEPEAVPPPPPATGATKAPPAQGGTKTCGACGMEIPAGATTCPVCGAPT